MSGNGTPTPFQVPAGTPLVGQPFTIVGVGVPMNVSLTCNCLAGASEAERPLLTICLSAAVVCAACGTTYNALFNPQTKEIQMHIVRPTTDQVPS